MKPVNTIRTPGYVYILTNKNKTVLYIGVTSDLRQRIWQHKNHFFKNSFAGRYNLERLIYIEECFDIESAIAREKVLKGWTRERKESLINSINPDWKDLSVTLLLE